MDRGDADRVRELVHESGQLLDAEDFVGYVALYGEGSEYRLEAALPEIGKVATWALLGRAELAALPPEYARVDLEPLLVDGNRQRTRALLYIESEFRPEVTYLILRGGSGPANGHTRLEQGALIALATLDGNVRCEAVEEEAPTECFLGANGRNLRSPAVHETGATRGAHR